MTGLIICIVCVRFTYFALFPKIGVRSEVLSCKCKTKKAYFTGWMSFLPRNLMEEISPNSEILSANT